MNGALTALDITVPDRKNRGPVEDTRIIYVAYCYLITQDTVIIPDYTIFKSRLAFIGTGNTTTTFESPVVGNCAVGNYRLAVPMGSNASTVDLCSVSCDQTVLKLWNRRISSELNTATGTGQ